MKFDIYIYYIYVYLFRKQQCIYFEFLNFKKFLKNYIFKDQILVNNNFIHKINKDLLDIEFNIY